MIENARRAENGSIRATIAGAEVCVPDDPENGHWQMLAAWEADGNTIEPYVPAPQPQPVPASITPLQARNGLRAWGIGRAQIDAFLDAIEDEVEREAARDAWEYATQIDKDNPLVAACAAFLGKTEADVEQFFADAAAS